MVPRQNRVLKAATVPKALALMPSLARKELMDPETGCRMKLSAQHVLEVTTAPVLVSPRHQHSAAADTIVSQVESTVEMFILSSLKTVREYKFKKKAHAGNCTGLVFSETILN